MTSLIPYNSYIVLVNTNNSNNDNSTGGEYITWFNQLTLISSLAANLTEFLQMVGNIVVYNDTQTFSYYINNAETKKQLIQIYNSVLSSLEKADIPDYITSLSNVFILIQFPVYLSSLLTSCTYIDEKNKNTIDYNQIALIISVNLAIVTSPANLKVLFDYTNDVTEIQDKINAVNGLDFIIIMNIDPTTPDPCELVIDNIITNSVGPIDQYTQINASAYAQNDDIDAVLYQETTLLNIMEKYAFLKIYMQNILKTRDMIVSIVLVRPTDTTFIKGLRIFVGIIIGISFIGIIPIAFSLFYYIWRGSDVKNVMSAVVLLVLLYLLMTQFDTLCTTIFT